MSKPIQDKLANDLGPNAVKILGLVRGVQVARRGHPLPRPAESHRHLKWRALDRLERALMVLCGVAITGFTVTVICDVVTRTLGRPWLWLQEVTMTFFIYGVFIGTAAATRRNDHLYLAALAESMSGRKRLAFETFNRLVVLAVAAQHGLLRLPQFSRRLPQPAHAVDDAAGEPVCGDPAVRRAGRAVRRRAAGQRLEERLRRSRRHRRKAP